MARAVENNYDRFLADAPMSSATGTVDKDFSIQVPHYIGRLICHQKACSLRDSTSFNAIAWIKFVREWFRETYDQNLGLKDAKDIVDYYITMGAISSFNRPAHLQ